MLLPTFPCILCPNPLIMQALRAAVGIKLFVWFPLVILTPSQVLGNPLGPTGSPPGSSMMPGVAGSSPALSSPQCLGQQAFGEGGTGKSFMQQGVYSRGGYPGGPGFTTG